MKKNLLKYLRHQGIVEPFVTFAESKGGETAQPFIHKSYKLLERSLYGKYYL